MTLSTFSERLPIVDLSIGLGLILLVVAIFAIHSLWSRRRRRRLAKTAVSPYERKPLLSERERAVYAALRPLAEQRGLHVLCKVRLADFIAVSAGCADINEWNLRFGRIRAAHADFVLAHEQTLEPRLLIEVEPAAHTRRQIYAEAGLPVLYVESADGLAQRLDDALAQNALSERDAEL